LQNQTSLIIWDEAPMAHKFCFEALDQSLRDIIKTKPSSNQIFGGKVIIFGGASDKYCQSFQGEVAQTLLTKQSIPLIYGIVVRS